MERIHIALVEKRKRGTRKMEDLRRLELSARTILLNQIANTHPTARSVSLNETEQLKVNHKLFLYNKENSKITVPSPSSSLKLKGFAQVRGTLAQVRGTLAQVNPLCLGESSIIWNSGHTRWLAQARISPERDILSLKIK
ncbi:hypothetical protein DEO72_LG7g615 [Vigna unguiculata]|uniref:Uncharacterized protein n=1 Tax=Vigna unguiculata TaxID=3917 RepID=A0A4D6MHX5_VIGUN|nr:hypothetical protein DEO72_LG7g615 [Vigna unguiculata]